MKRRRQPMKPAPQRRHFGSVRRHGSPRRRLWAETLEDRRLLAQLSFLPTDGEALQAGTLIVEAGETINLTGMVLPDQAQVDDPTNNPPSQVQTYTLNFANSTAGLTFSNYAVGDSNFSSALDPTIDDNGNTVVAFAAPVPAGGGGIAQVPIPPAELLGSFDVVIPADAAIGDTFTVSANFDGRAQPTVLGSPDGTRVPITDFGDLTIQVGSGSTAGVDLELTPTAATGVAVSEEMIGGITTTVVTVAPGTVFPVAAVIESAPTPVNGYSFNFSSSASELMINSYDIGTSDFQFAPGETGLDSAMGDRRITANLLGAGTTLAIPPSQTVGTFLVTAPTAAADYRLSTNFITDALTATFVSDASGNQQTPIDDFGDIIVRVEAVATGGVDLELTPTMVSGSTINEEVLAGDTNPTTVITVTPGTAVPVTALIQSAPSPVNGYSLNFSESDTALLINQFSVGSSRFAFAPGETGLDSAANDFRITANLPGSAVTTPIPPAETLGTFVVTAPTAAGDYRLTTNSITNSLTATFVSDGDGNQQSPIDDFGDIIIRVQPVAVGGVDLELTPVMVTGSTISEETLPGDAGTTTVITVSAGTVIPVTAQIESAPAPVNGYSLNFESSDASLLINNYDIGASNFVFAPGETGLDSAAGDRRVTANLPGANNTVTIPPAQTIGTFDVTAPTTPGDYRLTTNAITNALTATFVSDGSGNQQMPIDDFGDIIVRVEAPVVVLPTINVAVSPASVTEDGTDNLTYTFTRMGDDLSQPVTVNYTTTGTATAGTDFAGTAATVVILENTASATVVVDPTVDSDVEPDETVVLTISPDTANYIVGGTAAATGTITNDDVAPPVLPTINVSVSPASVAEDGDANLIYTFTRAGGDQTQAVTISYATSGTANAGTDFIGTASTIIIPANSTSASVVVDPTADTDVEPDETVVLTVTPTAAAYIVGATPAATGTITNDDTAPLPTVSVSVSPGSVEEDGTANLVYTFTRTGGTDTAIMVNYTTGGTATEGTDFTGTASSVTIPASGVAMVIVDPTADVVVEPDETVVLTIAPSAAAYNIGTASASATINNDDQPGGPNVSFVNGVITVLDGDDIEFYQIGGQGDVFVRVDDVISGPFADSQRFVAFGNDGDDSFVVVPNTLAIPVEFNGGAGNDRIFGAAGDDVLEGGDGNDQLFGLDGTNELFQGLRAVQIEPSVTAAALPLQRFGFGFYGFGIYGFGIYGFGIYGFGIYGCSISVLRIHQHR